MKAFPFFTITDRLDNLELDVKGLEVAVRRSEKNIMEEIGKLKDVHR